MRPYYMLYVNRYSKEIMWLHRHFVSIRGAIRYAKNKKIFTFMLFRMPENGCKAFAEEDYVYKKGDMYDPR